MAVRRLYEPMRARALGSQSAVAAAGLASLDLCSARATVALSVSSAPSPLPPVSPVTNTTFDHRRQHEHGKEEHGRGLRRASTV